MMLVQALELSNDAYLFLSHDHVLHVRSSTNGYLIEIVRERDDEWHVVERGTDQKTFNNIRMYAEMAQWVSHIDGFHSSRWNF